MESAVAAMPNGKRDREDDAAANKDNDNEDEEDLFASSPKRVKVASNNNSTTPPKRERSSDMEESDGDDNKNEEEEDLFAASPARPSNNSRKAGLSKFVRRILDPNRKPTGLIEPPQVIPLNDEFLKAFGQREKEMDAQIGRSIDVDNNLAEDEDENDDDQKPAADADKKEEQEPKAQRKIKITNLKYTTTAQALREECMNFGAVEDVNMIMDDNDPNKNTGRAYVLFVKAASAEAAVQQQLGGELDGRNIRVSMAEELSRGGTSNSSNANNREKRYWQRDISTKCFRCGKVGHMEGECPNPQQVAVCPLCANIHMTNNQPHELRQCPLNRICFNCGIPGHINRECPKPRGSVPPRRICTICCGSGHTRFQCQRASSVQGIQDAICLVCGQRGHFMCSELKWFFGLEGIFCYNCGGKGHAAHQCNRPTLDDLARNEGWTVKEIERAEEYKLSDDLEVERAERQRKEREEDRRRAEQREQRRDHYRDKDRRARSAPRQRSGGDPRNNHNNNNNNGGGQEYRYVVNDPRNNHHQRQRSGGRRRGYR